MHRVFLYLTYLARAIFFQGVATEDLTSLITHLEHQCAMKSCLLHVTVRRDYLWKLSAPVQTTSITSYYATHLHVHMNHQKPISD